MDEQKAGSSKKAWWILGIVIVLILIVVGISSNKKPAETGPIKIGFVAPLTGDVASIGQNMKMAAELAVAEVNSAGGINGRMVAIIAEDGKCDGKEAVTAVTKLINLDKVPVIVGGACSSETVAPAPIAEKAKVVMLSPLSSSPAITTAGDYIFRDYPSDAFQGVRAAEFAVNTLKAKNIAVLSCVDDYCQGVQQVFKDKAVSLGATIIVDDKYEKTANDLKTQLTKIKSANPDLVYFVGYTDGAVIGLKQAKEIGLNTKFLGGDAWNDPKIVVGAGLSAEGIMYLIPTVVKNSTFDTAMTKSGSKEITIGSREAYDAVKILAQVIAKVGTDSSKIKDALYKVQNYQGVSGSISFDKNGDISSSSYDVKVIKGGKPVDY
jgi:branched-chain amino acid transport system substrate-binding protein